MEGTTGDPRLTCCCAATRDHFWDHDQLLGTSYAFPWSSSALTRTDRIWNELYWRNGGDPVRRRLADSSLHSDPARYRLGSWNDVVHATVPTSSHEYRPRGGVPADPSSSA